MSILQLLSFILLALLPITATTFKTTDSVGELSKPSTLTSVTTATTIMMTQQPTQTIDHLFEWAEQHGAKISSSIKVQQYGSGGRGLYATQDIPANTELITIPYHLQLGVRQLAMGSDVEMQSMAKSLPWEYIIKNELGFIPLSVALVAELRKGQNSIFHVFLKFIATILW